MTHDKTNAYTNIPPMTIETDDALKAMIVWQIVMLGKVICKTTEDFADGNKLVEMMTSEFTSTETAAIFQDSMGGLSK